MIMAQPSRRNRQVTRTLELIVMLSESRLGCSLNELAASVQEGVATRTIRRDLEAVEAAGFTVYDDLDDQGVRRWKLLGKGIPARNLAA